MNKKPLNKKNIINIFKRQNRIKLGTEWLNLENCKERILAEDIKSKINVPPFPISSIIESIKLLGENSFLILL